MSLGQSRVRPVYATQPEAVTALINDIKDRGAAFIDLCEKSRETGSASTEQQRLWSLAQTDIESAVMWAVKAATRG